MNYIFYPTKDSTIYEGTSSLNTGRDQILEISHDSFNGSSYNSRALLEFNTDKINDFITKKNLINNNIVYKLKLFVTEKKELSQDITIDIHPLFYSWNNGLGKWQHRPYTINDVNWKNRKNSTRWETGSYQSGITGSWRTTPGGGNWYDNIKSSHTFDYETEDLNSDVTTLINGWVTGSIVNNGMIVKFEKQVENETGSFSQINFFSRETNTIFPPQLHLIYDDSVYVTGSATELKLNDIVLAPSINTTYKKDEIRKIKINVREKYPTVNFSTTSSYLRKYRLPAGSYYSIIDDNSNITIVDFSEGTKISHDNNENYFILDFDCLFPKRYYRLKFLVEKDNEKKIFEHNHPFQVI